MKLSDTIEQTAGKVGRGEYVREGAGKKARSARIMHRGHDGQMHTFAKFPHQFSKARVALALLLLSNLPRIIEALRLIEQMEQAQDDAVAACGPAPEYRATLDASDVRGA